MMQAPLGERVRQRRDDVRLPDELAERARSPLAGQDLVTQGTTLRATRSRDEVLLERARKGGGEPFPRHLQRIAVAASFRT